MARYQCGACHAVPGVAHAKGSLAASLAQYGRRSYIVGRVPNRPGELAQWIADPETIAPGTRMPNMGVSLNEARDMAAYLGSLR